MLDLTRTSAILLAAGLSRRFGAGDKLLANVNGRPLAAYIAATLAGMDFAHRIAICRSCDGPLAELIAANGFTIVANPDTAEGQASSLRLGVAAAQSRGAETILVCLADMPFVTQAHLGALIALGRDSFAASIPDDGGPASPPAAFNRRHFAALLAMQGDKGARDLLRQAPTVTCPARELADFDTVESLAQATAFS